MTTMIPAKYTMLASEIRPRPKSANWAENPKPLTNRAASSHGTMASAELAKMSGALNAAASTKPTVRLLVRNDATMPMEIIAHPMSR